MGRERGMAGRWQPQEGASCAGGKRWVNVVTGDCSIHPPGQTLPIRLPASTLRCLHPHPDGRSPRPARLPVRSHAHRVTARRRRATSVSLVQFPVKNKPSLPLLAAAAELPRQRRSLCYGRAGCSPRSSRRERSASAPQDEGSTSRGLSPS